MAVVKAWPVMVNGRAVRYLFTKGIWLHTDLLSMAFILKCLSGMFHPLYLLISTCSVLHLDWGSPHVQWLPIRFPALPVQGSACPF